MEQLTLITEDEIIKEKVKKFKEENINIYQYNNSCNNISTISKVIKNYSDEVIYFEIDDEDILIIKNEISKRSIFRDNKVLKEYIHILEKLKFFAVVDENGYYLFDEVFYKTRKMYNKYLSLETSRSYYNDKITSVKVPIEDCKIIKIESPINEMVENNIYDNLKDMQILLSLKFYNSVKYNKKLVEILVKNNIPYTIEKIKGIRSKFYELIKETLKIDIIRKENQTQNTNTLQKWQMQILRKLPLDIKIKKTEQRIIEWYEYYNGNVYISFSGGKDSTVLYEIAKSIYPNIDVVFVNTGLEYPEIIEFVKSKENVTILKPEITYRQVLQNYGYPVISKEISAAIRKVRSPYLSEEYRNYLLKGDSRGSYGKIPDEYQYLINAPFNISEKCCDIMKKHPIYKYEKENGKVAITAEIAEESRLRMKEYLKHGCNAFNKKRPKSTPLGFWTENDILEFIYANKIPIASIYGNVIKTRNSFTTTGEKRTGCIFCLYGIQYEKTPNRLQRLQNSHPQLHEYCINKLGIGNILDYMKIPYYQQVTQLALI